MREMREEHRIEFDENLKMCKICIHWPPSLALASKEYLHVTEFIIKQKETGEIFREVPRDKKPDEWEYRIDREYCSGIIQFGDYDHYKIVEVTWQE